MKDNKKINKYLAIVTFTLLAIVMVWFIFTVTEYVRVEHDKRPILCFSEKKEVLSNAEYAKTCKGILTKYREYYSNENNNLTGREYVIFVKDFNKSND